MSAEEWARWHELHPNYLRLPTADEAKAARRERASVARRLLRAEGLSLAEIDAAFPLPEGEVAG